MAVLFATVTEEEIRQINEEATPANTKSTCLVNSKTTIPSVSMPCDLDIYLTFDPLQGIVVNYSTNAIWIWPFR